jgi:predicted signal transduction protein with EAL and GGDEF domain
MSAPVLPDHLHFLSMLGEHLARAEAGGHVLGLALVQVPCVSRVDALMGYRQGDDIARCTMEQLSGALKPGDHVYRVDRATLACVLTGLGSEGQAWAGAYKMLRTLGRQVEIGGHSIQAMPAIGLALFPAHANDPDGLLQRASLALQSAPRARDHIAVYDAARGAASQHELDLQSQLRHAVEDNGLLLHFQPKLDLASGAIVSSEALSRWDEPVLGKVAPEVFIRAAETAGWMPRLTHWLLHAGLRQTRELGHDLSVSINLSAQDLSESDLPELVAQALATWDIAAPRLILEITETIAMEDDAALEDNLRLLRELGVRLSIDDFGTGYSSLARLKLLPVDEIKIDVSFVRDMTRSVQDERIVRSIIDLAHNLGILVVAEGVEDAATLDALAGMNCDIAQGFHISRPLPAHELADFLRRHRPQQWARAK